ncbi:acetyl/propionyl-CoA carboxylase, alpha subunit [Bernardetia litoralis DSM 6794]|uniref:Acetyl/propionyl-CoA carboxylase, alpha subunit n=1 Tax=Bernardetia litoralis (strain ATCC 23117 / DSM 6794 / NBRC 15988 / NCIMB 1366 / Fx l1 / Sio-4) TaxID=880071 RepID=I4AKB6_BERLS|nr:acetyl-CoA carboxylase biotin carboxyl carrier protein subunit [Bernardetia litoralis]AFM04401.1 acetyl/propionyl-CoA carboxylase, alpha subunit [Bernardetia litoralis DSM 6794]
MQITTQSHTYQVRKEKNTSAKTESLFLNDNLIESDIQKFSEREFHVLRNNISYRVEVLKADYEAKEFEIRINGNIHKLTAKDRMDLLLESLGMENAASAKVSDLKAPMPGLVLDILIEEGATTEKGTPLMILEAMKMENVLKATGEGKIKSIAVKKGQNVEKGAVLIEFE